MPPTAIRIMCPNLRCRAILAVPEKARGKLVKCKSCGGSIRVPAARVEPPRPEEAEADEKGRSAA